MPTNQEKLKGLLTELFQLDQADLDFGIYRIMNQKREEVVRFLDNDLLPKVQAAFKQYKSADKTTLEGELAKLEASIRDASMNPDDSPKVLELRKQIGTSAVDVAALENEVFSHLFNFFRRYYSDGDFISLRRYKEGVYAIPYEGEEVKLHWANADQYYIKSSETFRDYTFTIQPGKRVHLRLVAATTEQDNNKPRAGLERRFVLRKDEPVREEKDELYIHFEYRLVENKKQDDLNDEAVDTVLKADGIKEWTKELSKLAPIEKKPKRTLLEKHLTQYTAKNTFDYFIHKDLGKFLRRELDFYIKNEVMHLDDIEHESVPKVEQYLSQIKVIRAIAHKIITFLEQIENFQKKMWTKKKFVTETNYCITLDRVPDELLPEVAKNLDQHKEWVDLFGIDTIKKDLTGPGYSKPLKVDFLKAHQSLVLDTRHFDRNFVTRLLTCIQDLDASTTGLIVKGENSQAIALIAPRYEGLVDCEYIDPPYNTGTDGFVYKDSYPHSTWLAMMDSRLRIGRPLLRSTGLLFCSIDDHEVHNLRTLADQVYGEKSFVGTLTWISTTQPDNIGRARFGLQQDIEYITLHSACARSQLPAFRLKQKSGASKKYPHTGKFGSCRFEIIERSFEGAYARPTMQFRILGQLPREGKQWQIGEETARNLEKAGKVEIVEGIVKRAVYPEDESPEDSGFIPFWSHLEDVGTSQTGKAELTSLLSRGHGFETVKPVSLLTKILSHVPKQGCFCDYFAGSGTTAHAIMNMNREDGLRRTFILVEMGAHFETVLLPRIKKVAYSPAWEEGKPTRFASATDIERGPGIIKYIRLESYEDALNNLQLKRTEKQRTLLEDDADVREQYLLSYMLDVESRGSQSLLNIDGIRKPDEYKLRVERDGETQLVNVDLVETFNWLLGLTVKHIDLIQGVRVVEGTTPRGETRT